MRHNNIHSQDQVSIEIEPGSRQESVFETEGQNCTIKSLCRLTSGSFIGTSDCITCQVHRGRIRMMMTSANPVHHSKLKLDPEIRVIMERQDLSEKEKIREYQKALLHNMTMKKTSNSRKNKAVCRWCGCFYQWQKSLQRHVETIHADIRYKCSACKRTFNRKDNFERHKKRLHPSHIRLHLPVYNELEQRRESIMEPPKWHSKLEVLTWNLWKKKTCKTGGSDMEPPKKHEDLAWNLKKNMQNWSFRHGTSKKTWGSGMEPQKKTCKTGGSDLEPPKKKHAKLKVLRWMSIRDQYQGMSDVVLRVEWHTYNNSVAVLPFLIKN